MATLSKYMNDEFLGKEVQIYPGDTYKKRGLSVTSILPVSYSRLLRLKQAIIQSASCTSFRGLPICALSLSKLIVILAKKS